MEKFSPSSASLDLEVLNWCTLCTKAKVLSTPKSEATMRPIGRDSQAQPLGKWSEGVYAGIETLSQ